MRPTWKLGDGSLDTRYEERKLERVLVEYDGPQLVLLRDDNSRYLAVASDADERHIRWVQVHISDLEWVSLAQGLIPVREVFQKPTVWIVDQYADGEMNDRGQEASGLDLVDDDLPDADALLPAALRRELAMEFPPTGRSLRLERRDRTPLDLGSMGLASRKFQAFWTACGLSSTKPGTAADRASIAKRSQLVPVATFPGSLGLQIDITDQDLFDVIVERVARLVASSGKHDALAAFFAEFPGVRGAYDSLLATLSDERVDILATWANVSAPGAHAAGAFFGSERATVVRSTIKQTKETGEVTFRARGHFRGYAKGSKRFEFFDTDAKVPYSGDIARPLAAKSQDASIVISDDVVYEAQIAERTYGDDQKPEYELQDFTELERR